MQQTDLSTMRARALRQAMTGAERVLWEALRDRRFLGLKFRRHVPMGPFVVPFLCAERKLIIDTSGPLADRMAARGDWLCDRGFTVVSLRDHEVLTDLPGCLRRLAERAAE